MARRFFRSRRSVALAVVVALTVVGVGASTASANSGGTSLGTCNGTAYSSAEALLACLVSLSNKADFEPVDTKVAAPSSVITATGSESPTRRVQEVNKWRPNTQAWLDAKTRLAGTSGLTSADIESTGRWRPILSKGAKVVGVAGLLTGDTVMTWAVRDGVIYPMLDAVGIDDAVGQVSQFYCRPYGDVVSDWLVGWVAAACGEWRADPELDASLRGLQFEATGSLCYQGICSVVANIIRASDLGISLGQSPDLAKYGTFQFCRYVTGAGSLPSTYKVQAAIATESGVFWRNVGSGGGYTWAACSDHVSYAAVSHYDVGGTVNLAKPMSVIGTRLQVSGQTVSSTGLGETEEFQWTTEVQCLDNTTLQAASVAWEIGGMVAPSPVELNDCVPTSVKIAPKRAGGSAATVGTTRSTAEVDTAVQDWMQTFPQCMDGSCLLELRKDMGGGLELDCFAAPDACLDWRTETANQTAVYRCYYANTLVDLAECNVYGRTFDRQAVQTGTAYSDPATGETVKTQTGTTVSTNPGAATVAMSSGVSDPSQSRQCWPTGWGVFNPFEWVYQPVKCALEWAFVPRESKLSEVRTALRLSVVNSQPAGVVQAVQAWGAAVPSVSGCAGPTITLELPADVTYTGTPISACSEPASTLAMVSRAAISIVFILFGLFAITRYVGRVFGFTGFGRGDDSE